MNNRRKGYRGHEVEYGKGKVKDCIAEGNPRKMKTEKKNRKR